LAICVVLTPIEVVLVVGVATGMVAAATAMMISPY
jgi:hypothetical protein